MGQLDGRAGQVINEEAWKWSISRSVKKSAALLSGFREKMRDFVFARNFAVFNLVLSNWAAAGQAGVKGSHEMCTALYLHNCSLPVKLQKFKNGKW